MSKQQPESPFARIVQLIGFEISADSQVIGTHLMRALEELGRRHLLTAEYTLHSYCGVGLYDFTDSLPDNWVVHGVEHVKWCGSCIDPVGHCGCALGYRHETPGCIELVPEPRSNDDPIAAMFTIKPLHNACSVPDAIAEQYGRILETLAKASLLRMVKQPWTDMRLSASFQAEAEADLASEAARVSLQFGNALDMRPVRVI